jgi:small multidrug resistance pump
MSFLYLAAAVALEVIATSALKASEQFTRLWPSVLVVLGYGCAFYLLSLCLRTMPLGIMYAVWSGLGVVLITIVGWLVYNESLDLPAFIGMTLILSGVVVIRVFSETGASLE